MKRYPLLILSLVAIAIAAPESVFSQNQRPVEPAPSTLPGATTEIYKTVGDVSLPLHIFSPEGIEPGQSRPAIVFYFGGGWRSGSPEQFINQCELVSYEGQPHGFFNYGRGDNSMFIATVTEIDRFLNSLGYLKGKPRVEKFLSSLNS